LGQAGSGIFLQAGLDYPNQIDPIQQITLIAQDDNNEFRFIDT
jgi:hypothetical protein